MPPQRGELTVTEGASRVCSITALLSGIVRVAIALKGFASTASETLSYLIIARDPESLQFRLPADLASANEHRRNN